MKITITQETTSLTTLSRILNLPIVFSILYSNNTISLNFLKTSYLLNINFFNIQTNKFTHMTTILHLRYSFNPLFFGSLEMFLYKNFDSYIFLANFESFLSTFRINIYTLLNSKLLLPSLSKLFSNTIWLEREILDFSNITFFNLVDTRRLLIDYTQKRQYPSNTIIYDYTYNHFINDLYTI